MQPESSDGFASVGTILPEGRAALLPGGSFRFWPSFFRPFRALLPIRSRLCPFVIARLAPPFIDWVHALKYRVSGAAFWANRWFELGHVHFGLLDDVLGDRVRNDRARLFELIGGDGDLKIPHHALIPDYRVSCAWTLDPALTSRLYQHLVDLPCLLLVFASAQEIGRAHV